MCSIPGFVEERFCSSEFSFPIFRNGSGPGVILLHELPGLTNEVLDLANFIAANGFHVVMPLLFGAPLQSKVVGNLKAPLLCIRREFNCFAKGKSSPITAALRELCSKIHHEQEGKGVGAIGMCFTGGFILTMMLEPSLIAPVIAQPALPFLSGCSIDVEDQTLSEIAKRSDDTVLLGLRFKEDKISPSCRMDKLQKVFTEITNSDRPKFERIEIPGKGHSTLTSDYKNAMSMGIDTQNLVLQHLRNQLQF
jgi:dienelactone hydrolase